MNCIPIEPSPSSHPQKPTILVVEDNVALRYTLAEWLRLHDYTVLETATADEAMHVLESPLAVDLVVTDVHMPGSINGIGLVHYINTAFKTIKVIIVSGEADRLSIAKDTVFFRKPYDLEQLTQHIAHMLSPSQSD